MPHRQKVSLTVCIVLKAFIGHGDITVLTAISRNDVGKSTHDNPEGCSYNYFHFFLSFKFTVPLFPHFREI